MLIFAHPKKPNKHIEIVFLIFHFGMEKYFILIWCLCALSCNPTIPSQNQAAVRSVTDSLAPRSHPDSALTKQLHTVTIATHSLDSSRRFYEQGMGLTLSGPISMTDEQKVIQRKLWNIPESIDWQLFTFSRPSVPGLIQIRLLVLNAPTPSIHQSHNPRELGSFSLGFPNTCHAKLDSNLRQQGWTSLAPMQNSMRVLLDGTPYPYSEAVYNAPDFVHAVSIERGGGMQQLSPIDLNTQLGGPGYSAQVVTGQSDINIAFYADVLGLELRTDQHWKINARSALGLDSGTPFRFSLLYAKGAQSGHLAFLDFKDGVVIPTNVAPRLPNRGIGMWTFPTTNIARIYQNALDKKVKIIHLPVTYESPDLGKAAVMTLLAPNGFLIEVFEKRK
jgi:catechol 2,3-dioxygenase-like lactoylglutathione lyase family enzyme